MLTLDGFEEITSCFQARVGAVIAFGGKSHRCTIRAAGVGIFVIADRNEYGRLGFGRRDKHDSRPTTMPGQADNDRTITPIIVVIHLFQSRSDSIVHLLIIVLVGCENTPTFARTSFLELSEASVVEVEVSTTSSTGETEDSKKPRSAGGAATWA